MDFIDDLSMDTYSFFLIQEDVRAWLKRLQLYEYSELFEREGYSTDDDIENLKDLQENDLRTMGISKRGMNFTVSDTIIWHNITVT